MQNERCLKMSSWVSPYLAVLPDSDWRALYDGDVALARRCDAFLGAHGLELATHVTRHGYIEDMVAVDALCKAIRHGASDHDGQPVRQDDRYSPLRDGRYLAYRHIPGYVSHRWLNTCDPEKTSTQLEAERQLVITYRGYHELENMISARNTQHDVATEQELFADSVRYEYDCAIDKAFGLPSVSPEGEQRMRNRMAAAWVIGGVACVFATMRDNELPISRLMEVYAESVPVWQDKREPIVDPLEDPYAR